MNAKEEELIEIKEIGKVLAKSIVGYFKNKKNQKIVNDLLNEIKIKKNNKTTALKLEGMVFVITGDLETEQSALLKEQ